MAITVTIYTTIREIPTKQLIGPVVRMPRRVKVGWTFCSAVIDGGEVTLWVKSNRIAVSA